MMRWWRVVPAMLITTTVLAAQPAHAGPTLTVTVVQSGLNIPWDVAFLPSGPELPEGAMIYTERSLKKLTLRLPNGTTRVILDSPSGMWASGETGLMSVEPAYGFKANHDFITCHGYQNSNTQDVRVVRWHLNSTFTAATKVRTLVSGLPSTSGRHGGCALVKGSGNILYVGTGDAATGKNPQSLYSGGGKVLRIDGRTGAAISGNRWIKSTVRVKRQIATYGHRNVQGLARRSDGTIWSVEHGSYRDDEVNRIDLGKNFGWNPVPRKSGDATYNEGANSPMTDYSIPGTQTAARWRSGTSTFATSGATFVYGTKWGSKNGALAVASLKDSSLRLLLFTSGGTLSSSWKPPALNVTYGRLRGAVRGPDGALYLTTSNGDGNDKILKVTPG